MQIRNNFKNVIFIERKELGKGKFGSIVCKLPEKEINSEALETKEINSDISKKNMVVTKKITKKVKGK